MAETLFDRLWSNHPAMQNPVVIEPCTTKGVSNYDNQCAIRFGVCLANSGISLASFRGACCWHRHGRTHFLRAEELMQWLNTKDANFVGYADISKRDKNGKQKSSTDYKGRRGIVVCRNFWGPGNQGDHIDLWNGMRMAHGADQYFASSQEIWFWEMN